MNTVIQHRIILSNIRFRPENNMGLAGQGIPGFFWRFSGFSWWLSLLVEEQKNKGSTRFRGLSQRAEEKIKQF